MSGTRTMDARRCELYADVEDCVGRSLTTSGIPETPAAIAAVAVVDMLATEWAGQNLTFPREGLSRARRREEDIHARMGRVSVADLAREHGISERAVRKAYHRARVRAKHSPPSTKGTP